MLFARPDRSCTAAAITIVLGSCMQSLAADALHVVENGKSPYQIVRSSHASRAETQAARLLQDYLKACGAELKLVTDKEGTKATECEIVVGGTAREVATAVKFDPHTVGNEGFLVKAAGQRLLIQGGSPDGTRRGVEFFLREFCGYTGDRKVAKPLADLAVAGDYEHRQRQQYTLTAFTVAGRSVSSMTIVASEEQLPAAEAFRNRLYECAGWWLDIAPPPATGPSIILSNQKRPRPGPFQLEVAKGSLIVRSSIPHDLERGIACFFANEVGGGRQAMVLAEGYRYEKAFADVVRYREFGARGDGKTDDIEAIAAAHEFANRHKLPVRADKAATYYIGGKDRTAVIQTNTDFGSARFVVDDTAVENRGANVFVVTSTLQRFTPEGIASLKRNQRQLGVSLPNTSLVFVTNSHVKRYIRYGANQNKGSAQTDVFIADTTGRVDMDAPIIWDFDEITSISAQPIDETTLTITGGHFTTIANAAESRYTYYSRGLAIRRSRVVVDGLQHVITGEGEHGAPYGGFINVGSCAYVTVRNTILTGHKTYRTIGSAGRPVSMGTYDISLNRALSVSFVNCSQTNDIKNGRYWGIMGSNYCKNLAFDNCTFSRFDAHMGVANAAIRNSTLGHVGINAIGTGTFLVENSTIYGRSLINLRSDYGSTWEGEFVIRNCVFVPACGRKVSASLIGGSNSGQHDFGYTCYMPERIVLEDLRIDDSNHPDNYNGPAIFGNFNGRMKDGSYVEKFPYVRTKEVVLRNVTTASGKPLRVSDNTFMFRDVKVTRE